MTSAVGQPAPEFSLPGVADGEERVFTLSEQRGHPVVLAFYPADDSPVCTRQMCSYQSGLERFSALAATVWGISSQDLDSHRRFAERHGLSFPLLSDTDRAVQRSYGVAGALMTKRAIFVVDAAGRLAWSHVSRLGLTFQGVDQLERVLAGAAR